MGQCLITRKGGSSKKYIFKDGKFSVEPTTNNFTNKSTFATDGYLNSNDNNSGNLLVLNYECKDTERFVIELQGLGDNAYTNGDSRYVPIANNNEMLSPALANTDTGMLGLQTKYCYMLMRHSNTLTIKKPTSNDILKFRIYRIWVEDLA